MTMLKWNGRASLLTAALAIGLGTAGCTPRNEPADNDMAQESPAAEATGNGALPGNHVGEVGKEDATKSIIRPDIEPSPTPAPPPEATELTVPFPASGVRPDAAGLALLDKLVADPVVALGGPVTIWGHSDSKGSDAANLSASRRRAEAARDYLVEKGIAADRMTVIALGEARPIAPNRKLDGTDDPQGRDKNRRVEIKVDVPTNAPAAAATPSKVQ
ncbi:OmpA family protein [uncultured Sphingomonas sp.]|uniref:OmpA family protein n=1 Tax=uncultured Sphingomonas sp. TaxID=158754 RepID=UPI0030F55263